jgi:hypothetical protein
MNKLSIRGIILGVVLVLFLDFIFGVLLFDLFRPNIETLNQDTYFLVGSLIAGTISTILGGYVAARIARTEPYWNAGAIGVFGIISGVFLAKGFPLWFNVPGFLTALPAALLGGYIATKNSNNA